MASTPAVLILGAGKRVGAAVAKKFAGEGYKVAIVSRHGSGAIDADGYLSLKADFSDSNSVPALFDDFKAEFKTSPNVVIYNAASLTPPSDPDSPLSIPADRLIVDHNINVVSPFVAASHATKGWETLPSGIKKVFIYTGNALNDVIIPVPAMLDLGIGKSASAYWIGFSDLVHKSKGYRFFYADQRNEDGSAVGANLDGPAHADFYASLADDEGNVPWKATFVKGKGYTRFDKL